MGPTRHLCYEPTPCRKAVADLASWTATAPLTYPTHDLAGDYVRPEGLDFREHRADPWVDLEHGLDPDVRRKAVGWARPSLHRPGGRYSVETKAVTIDGRTHRLPFGTTHFDRDDPLQRQVCLLVHQDALPGVSLEFRPDWTAARSLGRSQLEPRDAYDFGRASVVRWTHCVRPVNPGALTVLKALPPPDALHRALRDGRIHGERLHPVIRKSLGHYLPARVVRTTESKAMSPDPMASAYDDPEQMPEETAPEDDAGGSGTPTAQAAFDASQQFADLGEQVKTICEQTLAALKSGEHVKGRKAVAKVCETAEAKLQPLFEKLAADLADIGDAVAADLADDDADEPEEPSDVEEEAAPEESSEVEEPEDPTQKALPLERGADGILSRIPAVFRKAIKRFTAAEIAAPADPDVAYFANLQKSDPAAYADLCRSTRKVEREKKAADRWKKYTA